MQRKVYSLHESTESSSSQVPFLLFSFSFCFVFVLISLIVILAFITMCKRLSEALNMNEILLSTRSENSLLVANLP